MPHRYVFAICYAAQVYASFSRHVNQVSNKPEFVNRKFEGRPLDPFLDNTSKPRYSAGGTVSDRVIVIQSDHPLTLLDEIKKHGYTTKLTAG